MKKILFNQPYGVHDAVMNQTKVETRRPIKSVTYGDTSFLPQIHHTGHLTMADIQLIKSTIPPTYQAGEVVAIAQSYQSIKEEMEAGIISASWYDAKGIDKLKSTAGWSNKMFTKADLMPHHISIIYNNPEWLQHINVIDCLLEGIEAKEYNDIEYYYFPTTSQDVTIRKKLYNRPQSNSEPHCYWISPWRAFKALWIALSGSKSWYDNPLVYAYHFCRID